MFLWQSLAFNLRLLDVPIAKKKLPVEANQLTRRSENARLKVASESSLPAPNFSGTIPEKSRKFETLSHLQDILPSDEKIKADFGPIAATGYF